MSDRRRSIVVLFGGTSSERMVATASAQYIAAERPDAAFWFWTLEGAVLEVAREELLAHTNPFKQPLVPSSVHRRWESVDSALDAAAATRSTLLLSLHGGEGENGGIQRKIEARAIPFTGSDSQASATAFDKDLTKQKLRETNILLADSICVNSGRATDRAQLDGFLTRHGAIVCKPQRDGSSVGLAFIDDAAELERWWIRENHNPQDFIVEQRLSGREFTVGIVDLGQGALAMPVSEVVITNPGGSFDYDGKYLGRGVQEITPANLTPQDQTRLQTIGLTAHRALGCFGYSRTDIIMGSGGAYFLETNTLPGLTRASFIPQQLAAAGYSMREFLAAQIALAERRAS
jgi:D-alanine-D-alanine ligase